MSTADGPGSSAVVSAPVHNLSTNVPLQLSIPQPLSFLGDIAGNWRSFKQKWEFYAEASAIGTYSDKRKSCVLLHVIGEEAVKVYNNFTFAAAGDEFNLDIILAKFEEYCSPKKNETFLRHKFFTRQQSAGETIDQYANALRTLAKQCNFGEIHDSLIRDRFICGILNEGLRERLLRREDLTLDKAILMGRITEETNNGIQSLKTDTSLKINYASASQHATPPQSWNSEQPSRRKSSVTTASIKNCFYCKGDHQRRRCPAYGATCVRCKRKNHFRNSEACRRANGKHYKR